VGALANSVATEATRASEAYLYGATTAALIIQSVVYVALAALVSWEATAVSMSAAAILLFFLNRLVSGTGRQLR
jgi:ATP-binding cassette subfamily C protein